MSGDITLKDFSGHPRGHPEGCSWSVRFVIKKDGKFLTKSNSWGEFKVARVFNSTESCQQCIDRYGGKMVYCEIILGGI